MRRFGPTVQRRAAHLWTYYWRPLATLPFATAFVVGSGVPAQGMDIADILFAGLAFGLANTLGLELSRRALSGFIVWRTTCCLHDGRLWPTIAVDVRQVPMRFAQLMVEVVPLWLKGLALLPLVPILWATTWLLGNVRADLTAGGLAVILLGVMVAFKRWVDPRREARIEWIREQFVFLLRDHFEAERAQPDGATRRQGGRA